MPRNKVDLYESAALYTGTFPKDFTTYFRDTCLAVNIVSIFTITRK